MAGKEGVGKSKGAKAPAKDLKDVKGKTAEKVKGGIRQRIEISREATATSINPRR